MGEPLLCGGDVRVAVAQQRVVLGHAGPVGSEAHQQLVARQVAHLEAGDCLGGGPYAPLERQQQLAGVALEHRQR